jgi:colanic acid biosynthesis glycosyl transferase WcaI
MRIAIHDYGGYAFIFSLGRRLAKRGYEVLYAYAERNPTPPGVYEGEMQDPAAMEIRGVSTREPLDKYRLLKRWRQEREYGALLTEEVLSWGPDIVISANAPLDTQSIFLTSCRQANVPFVYWVQDLVGDAMKRILSRRYRIPGRLVGRWYAWREKQMISESDLALVLSSGFRAQLSARGVPDDRMRVFENWAPLEQLPVRSKANPWSRNRGLVETFNFLYAGSLGLKHDPTLLFDLANAVKRDPNARVVVVSEGLGASRLSNLIKQRGVDNIQVMPFQPMVDLPDVLATGDILVGVLNPDAGEYSVPSKVLSYCCAQRPILLAVPPTNPAASLVARSGAGVAAAPEDREGFIEAALGLKSDPARRAAMGIQGRAFAEAHFNLDTITDRFESIIMSAVHKSTPCFAG